MKEIKIYNIHDALTLIRLYKLFIMYQESNNYIPVIQVLNILYCNTCEINL